MSSSRLRGGSESFEWPPSPTDLSAVSVVLIRGTSARTAAPAVRHTPAAASPVMAAGPSRRRGRLDTLQQLTLLGAGMLVGAALPGLDDGRRPLVGVAQAAEASPLPAASVAPAADDGATRRTAVPAAPISTPASVQSPEHSGTPPAAADTPAAAAHRAAAPTRAPAVPSPESVDPRTRQVLRALRSYEAAYSRMDASAAARVWPTANQEDLTRTFTAVREQRLWLHDCSISAGQEQASGRCRGTLRYRPRVGDHSTRLRYGTWRFALEQESGRWLIRQVTVS